MNESAPLPDIEEGRARIRQLIDAGKSDEAVQQLAGYITTMAASNESRETLLEWGNLMREHRPALERDGADMEPLETAKRLMHKAMFLRRLQVEIKDPKQQAILALFPRDGAFISIKEIADKMGLDPNGQDGKEPTHIAKNRIETLIGYEAVEHTDQGYRLTELGKNLAALIEENVASRRSAS